MKKSRQKAGFLIAILAISGILSACNENAAVKVISVEELNSGYYGESVRLNGTVTDEALQNVFLEENGIIEEIYVKPGDHVVKGQALAVYNTEALKLQLEEEELKNKSLQLQIQKCQQDLGQLEQGKIPVQTIVKKESIPVKGGRSEKETVTETQGETQTETEAENNGQEVLNDMTIPFKGDGTEEMPYVFLVKPQCAIMGTFFNKMSEGPYWFRLEVHQEDKPEGSLIQAWNGNGSLLKKWHSDSKIMVENLEAVTELKEALKPEDIVEETKPEESSPAETKAEETKPEETESPDSGDEWESDSVEDNSPIYWGDGEDVWVEESVGTPQEDPAVLAEEIKKRKEETNQELRNLTLQMRQSDLNKKKLEKDLEMSTVNSAVDGVVKSVSDPRKEDFSLSDPIIQVVSQEGWYIIGESKETMLPYLNEGDLVSGLSYESGMTFEAEIREVSHFPSTTTMQYENENVSYYPFIAYLENTEGLHKDEYVEITIQTEVSGGEGIYLDQAFIKREDGKNYVMKRGDDGTLIRQEVTLGRIVYEKNYEIVSGLEKEDYIAFPYGKSVKEGAKTEEQSANEFWEEANG